MNQRSVVLVFLWGLSTAACVSQPYRPQPLDTTAFRARAESRSEAGLAVTAAVPGAEEAAALFGIPVYDRGIQPIWLEVRNDTGQQVRFAPTGTDRDYFSPIEVAYMHRSGFSKDDRAEMERLLYESALPRVVPSGQTRSGFVFTHLAPGTKGFNVDLFDPDREFTFTFFLPVPGFLPDHAHVDFDGLYADGEILDVDTAGLREALTDIPCCTTSASGEELGDPFNLVLIGEGEDLLHSLLRAEWAETARADDPGEIGGAQHFRGRPPDAVFRRQRKKAGDRSELRIWLAPMRVDGKPVWMAQVSHYLAKTLTGAVLDPDIDDARNYFLQLMWYTQGLAKNGWLRAMDPVPIDEEPMGFDGATYFTDGYRSVLWLSGPPFSMLETEYVPLDTPPHR